MNLLKAHSKTFHLASQFLPASMRQDASICYSFCRVVDDIADESPSTVEARKELDVVQSMLSDEIAPAGIVEDFILLSQRTEMGLQPALDLLQGMRSDLDPVVIETDDELDTYCYRAAGTVGLMMCAVLGVRDQAAKAAALSLGMAMQLTNICRDVKEDLFRQRIYLPPFHPSKTPLSQELLSQESAPLKVQMEIRARVSYQLSRAEGFYEHAKSGYRALPPGARFAIIFAANLYRNIGHRLYKKHSSDALHGRTIVPFYSKLSIFWNSLIEYRQSQQPALPAPQCVQS
ncbi:MAG: squalene/phytoene synthase family protein [Polyangiaceae bacterium]|nr:squalene/phytoene synthase family protein [Polyangiaceae bacterium]